MGYNSISFYTGKFLRKARKEKNMTGKQLAKLMHVSQQQISRYETGRTSLTLEQLSQLLFFLDKSWGELIQVIETEIEIEKKSINKDELINNYSLSKYLIDSLAKK
ncbi:helix-turn-helix domain-containing protein [Providencia rustigianii]|nr:helix-turn-helix transcriptional regulator [Providencia rustigianii]SUC27876.1 transcriptional regulator, y4mF family [Providencia rustigianii]